MNKQEAIKEIKDEIKRNGKRSGSLDYLNGKRDGLVDALKIIKQIDEPVMPPEQEPWKPKKAVIPQSVADWLEVCKENLAISLFFAMTPDVLEVNNQSAETIYWLKSARNQETFAKAWLDGYEVEKEKLYTVELPNPHGLGHCILVKDMYKNIYITYVMNSDWQKSEVSQLTEAEIKKDFDWAWRFAKEV